MYIRLLYTCTGVRHGDILYLSSVKYLDRPINLAAHLGNFPCLEYPRGRGGHMLRSFDSYAYTCGFESGLGHCAYGTLGKSPNPVVLCPVSPISEDACPSC